MEKNGMKKLLKKVFGFDEFKPNQEEIIGRILSGSDVVAVMPTGGGKSLCYQLPAMTGRGTVVVVSPLISLMKDQVDAARENNIRAAYINSSLSQVEMSGVYCALRNGSLNLLYIAPERLAQNGFLDTLSSIPISLFAIDEAHCISEWGHDFRPDYLTLIRLRVAFPKVPIAAFTATATTRVQDDIIKKAGLVSPYVLRASFDRKNLFYHVIEKEDVQSQVLELVLHHGDSPGIVYRTTRDSVEILASRLRSGGVNAVAYHAGMEQEERKRSQEAFNRDEAQVVVATIAFGMGIDKSNVRYVIHADLPKNVEGYYQETGRAGRDGERADCILLFGHGDIPRIQYFIDKIEDPGERDIACAKLDDMVKYASHNTCRRKYLLAYFGEAYESGPCGHCDVCTGVHEKTDITKDGQILMSAMLRTGERFGAGHILDVILGADTKKIREYGHNAIKTYGAGRGKQAKHWKRVLGELLAQEAITREGGQYPILRLTNKGRAILFGRQRIHALRRKEEKAAEREINRYEAGMRSAELFEKLRALRRAIAKEHEVPPFIIFSDRTLREMSVRMPMNLEEMRRVSGVGEMKCRNYGESFVSAIREYAESTSRHPERGAVSTV
jgi:ATP-dependent DNA helicase RecQ